MSAGGRQGSCQSIARGIDAADWFGPRVLGHAASIDAGAAPGALLRDGDLGAVGGGHAGAADAAGAAADDEEVEVVGRLLGSFRKARALPSTRWGRRPQIPLPKIGHDL